MTGQFSLQVRLTFYDLGEVRKVKWMKLHITSLDFLVCWYNTGLQCRAEDWQENLFCFETDVTFKYSTLTYTGFQCVFNSLVIFKSKPII